MKIAYITDADSVHAFKWISHFARIHEVILICYENQSHPSLYAEIENVKIFPVLPLSFPLKRFWIRIQTIRILKKILKENQTELIHSMYVVPNSFWAYLLHFKKHIITTRGSDILVDYKRKFTNPETFSEKLTFYFMKHLVENSLESASRITSTSVNQVSVVSELISKKTKVKLLRTGIDTEKWLSAVKSFDRKSDSYIILSCRSIKRNFNIHIIIEVIYLLNQNGLDCKLHLVEFNADRDYLNEIKELIMNYKLEHSIQFFAPKTGTEMASYYADSDVVVMIPDSDGSPNTALECMLCEKPLIMGSALYDPDLFNEQTVWALSKNDAHILADMIQLIMNSNSHELNKKTTKALNSVISLAQLNHSLELMEEIYQDVRNEI